MFDHFLNTIVLLVLLVDIHYLFGTNSMYITKEGCHGNHCHSNIAITTLTLVICTLDGNLLIISDIEPTNCLGR